MEALAAALAAAAALALLLAPPQHHRLRALIGAERQTPRRESPLSRMHRWRAVPGARRRSRRRRAAALVATAALAAELRAGQPLRSALLRAMPEIAPRAVAAATWGGQIPVALRHDAESQRLPILAGIAACWEVAEGSGAGMARALDRLVEAARSAEEVRVQLEAHLAAPRATARLLTMLPVIGLLLGIALGVDPLAWLLGTPAGRLCLLGGVLLTGAGLAWTGRIAARVEVLL